MQLNDIRYAIAVAECKSFSKAASKLFITQPALSQSIKRFENELGVRLFVRELNNVYPTEAGKLLINKGRQIIALVDELSVNLKLYGSPNTLRIGISTFYSKYYLPKIVPVFKERHPDIAVSITEDISIKLEYMLADNQLDLCMVPFPLSNESFSYTILKNEEIYLALPQNHSYNINRTTADPVNLLDFEHDKWIFLNKSQRFTVMGYALFESAGFTPDIIFESMNWDTVHSMIDIGEGIGFVPDTVIDTYLNKRHRPIYYHINDKHNHRIYAAVYNPNSYNIKHILDFAETAKQKISAGNL